MTPAEVVEAIELQTGRQLDKKVLLHFLVVPNSLDFISSLTSAITI